MRVSLGGEQQRRDAREPGRGVRKLRIAEVPGRQLGPGQGPVTHIYVCQAGRDRVGQTGAEPTQEGTGQRRSPGFDLERQQRDVLVGIQAP